MITRIDHIAIAVRDIDEASKFYSEKLGLEVGGMEVIEEQKTRAAFIQVGEIRIELVQPTQDDSPIAKFLEKRGEGIHHIAMATSDIVEELDGLAKKEVPLIDRKPKTGAHGARIAFLHPKAAGGVLFELCQRDK